MAEPLIAPSPSYALEHLTPCIGTEVHGIRMDDDLDASTIDWLAALLVERKVLFFRDQDITMEAHIAFAARFGALEVHPFTQNNDEHPEVIHLINDADRPPSINVWHSDVTWRAEPSLGSVLRARVVPDTGGDTLFANMEAAWKGLDDATKAQIEDLQAEHDNEGFLHGMKQRGASEEAIDAMRAQYPPAVHPVVRTHPVSGKKSLYVNRTFTRRILDMAPEASEALLQKLYLQAWIPDYQCRFRWRTNSVAFWDNRAAQHYAAADYYPARREMERVTIVGEKPF